MPMASLWCTLALHAIVNDLVPYDDGRRVGLELLDTFGVQLEFVLRELIALELLGDWELMTHQEAAVNFVREALAIVESLLERDERRYQNRYQTSIVHDGGPGRPRFDIPRTQLAWLLEKRFTVPQIADILGVSVRTVRRRMSVYDLSVRELYSQLTDQQLDEIVMEVQNQFPTCGNRQMQGHLLARGLRVQQHRIRESQRRIDPCGSIMRRLRAINRRQYRVNGPGALWHIDGNHKLIRYCVIL